MSLFSKYFKQSDETQAALVVLENKFTASEAATLKLTEELVTAQTKITELSEAVLAAEGETAAEKVASVAAAAKAATDATAKAKELSDETLALEAAKLSAAQGGAPPLPGEGKGGDAGGSSTTLQDQFKAVQESKDPVALSMFIDKNREALRECAMAS